MPLISTVTKGLLLVHGFASHVEVIWRVVKLVFALSGDLSDQRYNKKFHPQRFVWDPFKCRLEFALAEMRQPPLSHILVMVSLIQVLGPSKCQLTHAFLRQNYGG